MVRGASWFGPVPAGGDLKPVSKVLYLTQNTAVRRNVGKGDDQEPGFLHQFRVAKPARVGGDALLGLLAVSRREIAGETVSTKTGRGLVKLSSLAVRAVAELPLPLRALARQLTVRSPHPLAQPSSVGGTGIIGEGDALPELPRLTPDVKQLLVGPANSAGQGHLWADAAGLIPGWRGVNLTYLKGHDYQFASDYQGSERAVVYSAHWARGLRRQILDGFGAVLNESLLPLFGSLHFQDAAGELRFLQRNGVRTGVVLHGSDIRQPIRQVELVPSSVFLQADPALVARLQRGADRTGAALDRLGMPVFVSTPDLLAYRPDATWLPLQVRREYLAAAEKGDSAGGQVESRRVRVLHLPSRGSLKGSRWVNRQMRALQSEGLISYLTPEKVPHGRMMQVLDQADVVIDSIGLGAYGVTSVEAMALGKTVVAQVTEPVRQQVRELTGLELPIQEADRNTLTAVVEQLAADGTRRADLGVAGRDFVLRVHSRGAAAAALAPFLGPALQGKTRGRQ